MVWDSKRKTWASVWASCGFLWYGTVREKPGPLCGPLTSLCIRQCVGYSHDTSVPAVCINTTSSNLSLIYMHIEQVDM